MNAAATTILTLTLNTAIDRVIEVPGFRVGSHVSGKLVARYPAGKGVNVSRALARLGRASVAGGFVGREDAALFRMSLREVGVTADFVEVAGRTRENITLIDPINRTDTHVREAGFTVTADDVVRMLMTITARASGGLAVFAGSLPGGMGARELRAIIGGAKMHGAEVALDLSGAMLRTMLEFAEESAVPAIYAIKPNRAELAELAGAEIADDRALLSVARQLTNKVRWVIASSGADGAWLISRDGAWRGRIDVDPARIVNTVGCGDCMLAGVLDGLLHDDHEPDRALRRGLAAATANAMDAGIARFSADAVSELEKLAKVERISVR